MQTREDIIELQDSASHFYWLANLSREARLPELAKADQDMAAWHSWAARRALGLEE